MTLNMKPIEAITLLSLLGLASCINLSSTPPAPCGGEGPCSAPRTCLDGRCVAACYVDEECADGELCELGLCVPQAITGGVMSGAEVGGAMGGELGGMTGGETGGMTGGMTGGDSGEAGSAGSGG